eukprot:UN4306
MLVWHSRRPSGCRRLVLPWPRWLRSPLQPRPRHVDLAEGPLLPRGDFARFGNLAPFLKARCSHSQRVVVRIRCWRPRTSRLPCRPMTACLCEWECSRHPHSASQGPSQSPCLRLRVRAPVL